MALSVLRRMSISSEHKTESDASAANHKASLANEASSLLPTGWAGTVKDSDAEWLLGEWMDLGDDPRLGNEENDVEAAKRAKTAGYTASEPVVRQLVHAAHWPKEAGDAMLELFRIKAPRLAATQAERISARLRYGSTHGINESLNKLAPDSDWIGWFTTAYADKLSATSRAALLAHDFTPTPEAVDVDVDMPFLAAAAAQTTTTSK